MAKDKGEGKPSLREKAEKILQGGSKSLEDLSPDELASLFHELQVHQIKLRMQNEELRSAQDDLERSRKELKAANAQLQAEIAERAHAEEALRRSERRYHSFIEVTTQWAWATDPAGLVVEDVPALRAFTGQTYEQARGAGWADALHPDDVQGTLEVWNRAVSTKTPYETEYRMRRHDGAYRLLLARGVPILDDQGGVIEWVGTCIDITERKADEEALRKSREDLDRAQEVGQIGWWRLDTLRNVLTWSDENHRIFGVPKGTPLTYEAFLAIVHPDDREYVDTQWNAGLRGEPYDIEHRIVADGRVKWVREKAYLEFDKGGVLLGGFGITQDITKRRQAEEALREANEQLEEKVRKRTAELLALNESLMESRDQLRSLASDLILTEAREKRALASELHDTVAQMLAIAKLNLEATGGRLEGKSREEVKRVVQLLREASRQTRSLMADLSPSLLYEAGLGQALRALARRMGELHALAIEVIDDNSPKPLGEDYRILLFRAVQELLHNTVKHAKATRVKLSLRREGTQVRIEVEDDGVGFIASQRGRGDGMRGGFGLFSIQERLRHLGGGFEIFSQPGRGVRAVLVVPLQVEGEGEGRESAAVRILIAEDHRMMRDALASLLKESGFEVVGLAEDGLEAVRLTREVKPDVVLMDIQMPRMDGVEATRKIKADLPEIKVIGLSVQTEPQIASEVLAAGASSFVPKSSSPEELTEAIRTAVGSGKRN